MRTYVCAQCHVEYYFAGEHKIVTYPWAKGTRVEQIEAYYDEIGFTDWTHGETGAPVLKAQHPSSRPTARESTRAPASPAPIATCPSCARER